ncbi:MAG: trypsin-like serine peptidase [Actinomycetota bacterium]
MLPLVGGVSVKLARRALLAVLLLGLAAPAQTSAGVARAELDQAVAQDLGGQPGAVRSYWTPKRMRSAEAMDLLEVSGPHSLLAPSWPGGPTRVRPASPPTATRRSSRTVAEFGGGDGAPIPYTRTQITDPSVFPFRTNGRLFGISRNGIPYSCSATAVSSQNRSVVWTAGHCVYLVEEGGLSSSVEFVPGYANGNAPYGEWPATEAWMPTGWVQLQSPSYDMAALIVMEDQNSMRLEDVVGGRGIAWNVARNLQFDAFGYPASPPFDGESLFVCDSQYGLEDPFVLTSPPRTTAIGCDMEAGSSGGGWIIRDQYLNGLNSYGFEEVPEVLFGPYFGDVAANLYNSASVSTTPGPLPPELPPAPLVGQIHGMALSLRTAGHLLIRGQMSAPDGFAACAGGAPVGVFRIFRGEIFLLKIVTTDVSGAYSARVRDLNGRYIAFSPEGYADDLNVCSEVISPSKKHKHRRR